MNIRPMWSREFEGLMKGRIHTGYAPHYWIGASLRRADKCNRAFMARRLVRASLEHTFPKDLVRDIKHTSRSRRSGDFSVGNTCYHVTATPSHGVIKKAASNLSSGLHPVLLVPGDQVDKARHLAEDQEIAERITIIAIEDFIALNIIEMSVGQQEQFTANLKAIITKYNRRLEAAETDMSLKIELQ